MSQHVRAGRLSVNPGSTGSTEQETFVSASTVDDGRP